MEHQISKRISTILIAGVFLVSSSLLAFEIAFARLMSVMLSYHYVFAIVSISLSGLGAGGIFVHFSLLKVSDKRPPFDTLSLMTAFCSLSMTLAVIVAIQIGHMDTLGSSILLYCGIFIVPFFFGGVFLVSVFRTFPSFSSMLYGSDLAGAAAGCLGIVLALNMFGAITAIFFFALVTSVSSVMFWMANGNADEV